MPTTIHCPKQFRSLRTRVMMALGGAIVVTFLIFLTMALVMVALLSNIDGKEARKDALRLATYFKTNIDVLSEAMLAYTQSDWTVNAFRKASAGDSTAIAQWLTELQARGGGSGQGAASLRVLSAYSSNCTTLFGISYISSGVTLPAEFYINKGFGTIAEACKLLKPTFAGILTPSGLRMMLLVMRPVQTPGAAASNVTGYMLWGRWAQDYGHFVSLNIPPAAVTIWSPDDELPSDAKKAFSGIEASEWPLENSTEWEGQRRTSNVKTSALDGYVSTYTKRWISVNESSGLLNTRICSYFKIQSSKTNYSDSPLIRVDRPRQALRAGMIAIISLSCVMGGLVLIISIVAVLIVHFAVIKRLEELSRRLRTMAMPAANKAELDVLLRGSEPARDTGAVGDAEETDSSAGSSTGSPNGDEIGALDRVIRHKVRGLNDRVSRAMHVLDDQRDLRVVQEGVQVALSQCCWLTSGAPCGVTAPQTRDNITLDGILQHPVASECLKAFAAGERSLENVQFLVDTMLLHDVFLALDVAEFEQRDSLAMFVSQAIKGIREQYIVDGAPLQLNLSATTRKGILAAKNDAPDSHLFDSAVREITILVMSDVLPRFRMSRSFAGMEYLLGAEGSSKSAVALLRHVSGNSAASRKHNLLDITRRAANRMFWKSDKKSAELESPGRQGSLGNAEKLPSFEGLHPTSCGSGTRAAIPQQKMSSDTMSSAHRNSITQAPDMSTVTSSNVCDDQNIF